MHCFVIKPINDFDVFFYIISGPLIYVIKILTCEGGSPSEQRHFLIKLQVVYYIAYTRSITPGSLKGGSLQNIPVRQDYIRE